MKLKFDDIMSVYNRQKKKAFKNFQKGKVDNALISIELCAKIAYHINTFYVDNELEVLITELAKCIVKPNFEFIPQKSRYVLIDTNGSDNHGLTQQYIDAFIAADVEFAYIYEDTDLTKIIKIRNKISECPKATFFHLEQDYNPSDKAILILDFIKSYQPSKYFMHIMPWDTVATMVASLLKHITRFNINATDHAFWLGATLIDYSIEFRDYGCTVSIEKRGLLKEQLLKLPYYPPTNRSRFMGFPSVLKEKHIKVFSGGSLYKILGEGGIYFNVVKRLLEQNPDAHLLFAGTGQKGHLTRFIEKNNLSHRVHFIGSRQDIIEVFENCDIYLGTFPIAGGLMAQFAALTAKPILAYSNEKLPVNRIEGVICHKEFKKITYNKTEDLLKYAHELCGNSGFRHTEGIKLQNCLMTKKLFEEEFKYMMQNNKSIRTANLEKINYQYFSEIYLEVENDFEPSLQKLLAHNLKFGLVKYPKIFINMLLIAISKTIRK
jgi:hypothetical protein